MNLSVGEIARACKGRLVLRKRDAAAVTEETLVDSVTLDSRKVTAGGVFVATVGERVDGHRFIPGAFEAGAALAITEKTPEQIAAEISTEVGMSAEVGMSTEVGMSVEADRFAEGWGSYLVVEDSFQALKDLAEYYRGKFSIPVVGVTGSVGKTSTKEFVAGVLAQKYHVLKTEGNFNNEVGVPLTLLRLRGEHEAAVVEMGISDFGEMHRLSKMVRPTHCLITNIGQCHLENLKSREGILKAKTEIFDYMAPDGVVCLNGGDDMLRSVTQVQGRKTHFFGLGDFPGEEVYASDIKENGLWGSEALLHMSGRTQDAPEAFDVQIPLSGRHMVVNAAAAACVGRLLGLTPEQIAEGIRRVTPVGGRNNLLRLPDCTVIDDCYNANPVSMQAAVDLLAMADTYRVAVLGDMFELGEDSDAMHVRVGAYAAASGADCIVCVGENARRIYEGAVEALERMARETGTTTSEKVYYFATREEALREFAGNRDDFLPKGCTVLVKASHGMKFSEIVDFLKQ
ncbi:MAG: UDP-N-acetylmuramoyl-tripeptide--D-alanyl-D-alanine ligase [Muribaculum sp.]|nr:UDP-N-acetylmuramoyl-tripeptide--D-alanyl-D-alanine ligase [Muribaculum sp.]